MSAFGQINPFTPRVIGIDYIAVPKPGQYHASYYAYCPYLTAQPDPQDVNVGDTAEFSVVADGNDVSYQWQVSTDGGTLWALLDNGPVYSGVREATLSVVAASDMDGYLYRCVLTQPGCDGEVSGEAELTVESCPVISDQPQNISADSCGSTEFSVSLDFEFPGTTYQWQISTNSGGLWSNIANGTPYSGVTTDTLSITPVPFGGNGYWYRCVISLLGCSPINSDHAVLTVVDDPQVAQWVGYVNSNGGGFAGDSLAIARELMCQIKLSGFASKIKYLLPFLGTGIGAARAPLIDRMAVGSATNSNFVNGDFSQSTGLQGNGTNKVFNTNILFTQLGVSNESGIGWWENNINLAGNVHPMGCYATTLFGQQRFVLDLRSFTRSYVYGATATNSCGQGVAAINGHYYGQRNTGSVRKLFLGGVQIGTNTFVGGETGVGSQTIIVCGSRNDTTVLEPWPGRAAVAYLTDGTLTDGQVAILHQLLIDYLFTPTGRPYA